MEHDSEKLVRQIPEWAIAKEYGIDVAMLLDNTRRSPAERIKRHQVALNTVLMLRKAVNENGK